MIETVGLIQMGASADKHDNLVRIEAAVKKLANDGCDLVVLPEMAMYFSGDTNSMRGAAESAQDGHYVSRLAELARKFAIAIHSGSMMERANGEFFNTSLLLDRKGETVARYRKIHRFDVNLPDGKCVRESDVFQRGDEVVVAELEGRRIGLAICYDLRFPELFRQLDSARVELILVPAAFATPTGADHWELLLRARALDAQCFVAGAGQYGPFDRGGYVSFGHSMVVDPWGSVVANAGIGQTNLRARLDFSRIAEVRAMLPIHSHRVLNGKSR